MGDGGGTAARVSPVLFHKNDFVNFILPPYIPVNVMSSDTMTEFVAEHPKMVGILFTTMLLLSKAGAVAAGGGNGYAGP